MKALITGATHGLGLAIAREFHKNDIELVLLGRNDKSLMDIVDELKGSEGYVVDLLDHGDLISFFSAAEDLVPDILVNCAGMYGPIGPFAANEWGDWERTIALDLVTPARLCWHWLPRMMRRGYGKIINISGGGATKARPNFSAYSTSKAALVRFTETLAEEVKLFHIDVNAVAPGMMRTAMTDKVLAAGPEAAGVEEYKQAESCDTTPERAAKLVAFLASHESDGITGRLISVHDQWEGLRAADFENAPDKYKLRRQV